MRICVLTPSYESSTSPFKGHDPSCDPSRFAPEHEWTHLGVDKARGGAQLRDALAAGFDVFVNLCDGAWDEDRAGIEVVRVLEAANVAFTGATSAFYEPSREAMKRACRYMGVDAPRGRVIRSIEALPAVQSSLRFPMIVKHPSSYGSVGMRPTSRVADAAELGVECARMLAEYQGALVEEFVEGREFTVLVCENPDGEPISYRPMECRFPAGETFKHFDLKWRDFDGMAWVPVDDEALDERLRAVAVALFLGLNGTGYGRVDVRMDADGRLFALEINPNGAVFYPPGHFGSADQILDGDPRGHAGFLQDILRAAHARVCRPAFEVAENGHGGLGMIAARDLGEGEVIDAWEGKAHRLVSRKAADRWTGRLRDWFGRYAWPIGEDVFAIWHEDPMDWRPIDHSCDPNAWLDGLDLVARRPIRAGASITCDYGTFCAEDMTPFVCGCGSPSCRGTITGADAMLPAMDAYGEHLSPYISARRRR